MTAKLVVALDIGATKIAGGIVEYAELDRPPRVVERAEVPTQARLGGARVLETVAAFAAELAAGARREGRAADAGEGDSDGEIVGVGVGTSGIIDPRTGSVRHSTDIMPGWMGQPLCARLSEVCGLPAAALNDVQAHGLGEARWGVARGASSCLCVGVGTGVGGAFVLDGNVVKGFHGAAGHIGHTPLPAASGLTCACGAPAHMELVASGTAIAARYQGRKFSDELDPALMGGEVARRAAEGELEALSVIEFCGRALGEAIGGWCNILDPELVVLSGSVTAAGHAWRAALDEGFKSQVLAPLADTPIFYAALGADAPLIGAAEHLLDTVFR